VFHSTLITGAPSASGNRNPLDHPPKDVQVPTEATSPMTSVIKLWCYMDVDLPETNEPTVEHVSNEDYKFD